jgi:hypothetical protein
MNLRMLTFFVVSSFLRGFGGGGKRLPFKPETSHPWPGAKTKAERFRIERFHGLVYTPQDRFPLAFACAGAASLFRDRNGG